MALPHSLFDLSLNTIVQNHLKLLPSIRSLPGGIQCDVYRQMYNCGHLKALETELTCFENVTKLLRASERRLLLYKPLQSLCDSGINVGVILCEEYSCQVLQYVRLKDCDRCQKLVPLGISLGNLFFEMGWFYEADKIFYCVLQLCKELDPKPFKIILFCHTRLLQIRTANCQFSSAKDSYEQAVELASQLESLSSFPVSWIPISLGKCQLLFAMNHYREAYQDCLKLLTQVNSHLPVKVIVDILRIASKACVVKRKYRKAEYLVTHAVELARQHFGEQHPTYADCLVDYGFYLLNVDSVNSAVKIYQTVLDIRESVFGENNLCVAMVHEDLGYASYVQEYSSGEFENARWHAQMAIDIISRIMPQDHLLLASSKRVKALVLEEIAIDRDLEEEKLDEAQNLHLASLLLARQAFGEDNVQIAKHFGNLGRLYQSMKRYHEAEEMHKRAIEIKERLLGKEDYEVALSLGHLASLYTYDMNMYDQAEQLYIRSIAIGRKLFGDGYSGLEYDYRGLIHLYKSTGNFVEMLNYSHILERWHGLRENQAVAELNISAKNYQKPTEKIIQDFFTQLD
ncbi:amyloid protein-binding protein 2-like [Dendronephthya gigantea]|uniref:amyloid protein-binding protein 2-like n=1 Tax=Dendronephthya gigantea TaxID=151771 RepID=UPI00106BB879|nr:amyloid protein-binding protein 2-like [Dendronephthya gigantea]